MKKSLLASLLLCALSVVGCGGGDDSPSTPTPMLGKVRIGILQPNHPALEAAANGFKDYILNAELSDNEFEFTIYTPNVSGSDINDLAKAIVSTCDMALGIGTGVSQALKNAVVQKGRVIPTLFTAVTDPVGSGLVASKNNGVGFMCGTSDMNPVAEQIALVKQCNPDADKVGVLYTVSEVNSQVQANDAVAAISKAGMEAVVRTVQGASDISAVCTELASVAGLDAIYIPTDNNIAQNPGAVKGTLTGKGIHVICGEENMLSGCGTVTKSIDYTKLGELTGKMAVSIIKGEVFPYQIPVGYISDEECEYVMSSTNAASYNALIPQDVRNRCRDIG